MLEVRKRGELLSLELAKASARMEWARCHRAMPQGNSLDKGNWTAREKT